MLEITRTGPPPMNAAPVEFLRVELSSLADGNIFVALTATTVDPDDAQLLDQEIASDCVTTLDAALALIRDHVRIGTA